MAVKIISMPRLRLLLCLISLAPISIGLTQGVETLRQTLKEGLYTYVVTVLAPDLLKLEPTNPEAHLLYAFGLYYTNDPIKARLELDKAVSLNIELTAEVQHLNGLLRATEGDIDGALGLLQKAFEKSQDYTIAMDWGRIAWESDHPEQALEPFSHAANTDEGKRKMWPELNRGRIFHLILKDYDRAIEAYDQAITIFEDNDPGGPAPSGYVEAFFRLGQVYEAKGDVPRAKANYELITQSLDQTYEPAIAALERLAN